MIVMLQPLKPLIVKYYNYLAYKTMCYLFLDRCSSHILRGLRQKTTYLYS